MSHFSFAHKAGLSVMVCGSLLLITGWWITLEDVAEVLPHEPSELSHTEFLPEGALPPELDADESGTMVYQEGAGKPKTLDVEEVKVDEAVIGDSVVQKPPEPIVIRPARFANEENVRLSLLAAQSILFEEGLSSERYEVQILELEALMADSMSDPEALLATMNETFDSVDVQDPRFSILQNRMKADMEKSLGYLWSQTDLEGSLLYAAETGGDNIMTGWLTAQMLDGANYLETMETLAVEPSPDVLWSALVDVSKTDTVSALDNILVNHMDQMNNQRWFQLFHEGHNSSDSVLAGWFEENEEALNANPAFDEVEVIRMLRRLDPGSGPYMASQDLARVDAALGARNYEEAAGIFEELSALYDDTIDVSAVGGMPISWAMTDFPASSEWLLENAAKFSEQEAFESMVASVYRSGVVFGDDKDAVLNSALAIEDETTRAMALSNVLIPQVEGNGAEQEIEWVRDLPQGFAKQRTMAGYVLGLSRHSGDETLEAQVKFQFLQDEYDLEQLEQLVQESELSELEKNTTLRFLDMY